MMPITRLAAGAEPVGRSDGSRFFRRLERVEMQRCAPAYLNGHTGIVVALQTAAVVVKLDRPQKLLDRGSPYVSQDGIIRCASATLREV